MYKCWAHLNWNIQYISISLVLRWSRLVEAWCYQSQEWAKCTFESYCCIKRLYKIHFNKVFIKLFSSIWYFGTFIYLAWKKHMSKYSFLFISIWRDFIAHGLPFKSKIEMYLSVRFHFTKLINFDLDGDYNLHSI